MTCSLKAAVNAALNAQPFAIGWNDATKVWQTFQSPDDAERIMAAAIQAACPHLQQARPLEDWHEDMGACMWFTWGESVSDWLGEPAWIGTPTDSDWPDYHTHFVPHPAFPLPPPIKKDPK